MKPNLALWKGLTVWVYMLASFGCDCDKVNLTPENLIAYENNPATLTCSYNGIEDVTLFTFLELHGGFESTVRGHIVPSTCFGGSRVNATAYSYSCASNYQVAWTIKNISRSNDGDKWICRIVNELGTTYSNNVSISVSDVALTKESKLVDENTPTVLTCTYAGNETVTSYTWIEVIGGVGETGDIVRGKVNPATCLADSTVDETKYTYSCAGDNQMSWTIKNVDRSNDGDTWMCSVTVSTGSINTNQVSIGVSIPIRSVSMTIPTSDAILAIQDNAKLVFSCSTDWGLPVPDITWYKDNATPGNNSDDVMIEQTIAVTKTTYDELQMKTSTLSWQPSFSDRDNRVYCSAKNREDQTPLISTRKPLLKVYYRPDVPTEFGPVKSLIKSTEVTVAWKPGSNGGATQIFQVSFKKWPDVGQQWDGYYVNETDDDMMRYTLTDLESDTVYVMRIKANNRVGSSDLSDKVTVRTLEATTENGGMVIVGFLGAVFAELAVLFLL